MKEISSLFSQDEIIYMMSFLVESKTIYDRAIIQT